jgi:hypothetical protein
MASALSLNGSRRSQFPRTGQSFSAAQRSGKPPNLPRHGIHLIALFEGHANKKTDAISPIFTPLPRPADRIVTAGASDSPEEARTTTTTAANPPAGERRVPPASPHAI